MQCEISSIQGKENRGTPASAFDWYNGVEDLAPSFRVRGAAPAVEGVRRWRRTAQKIVDSRSPLLHPNLTCSPQPGLRLDLRSHALSANSTVRTSDCCVRFAGAASRTVPSTVAHLGFHIPAKRRRPNRSDFLLSWRCSWIEVTSAGFRPQLR
jgi:hypothetical protein